MALFYKLKSAFSHPAYMILKSYLTDRTFPSTISRRVHTLHCTTLHTIQSGAPQGSHTLHCTTLHTIQSGAPQGSILGPIVYSIYTAELPETEQTMTANYVEDTAILASHHNPITASTR